MPPSSPTVPMHDDDSLLALLWMASPTLPIGGFSYSEGLEAAVDAGLVHDETSAADWLCDQLWLTQARCDLAVLGQALTAWRASDWERLQALDQWVRLTRESAELRLQSEQMGRSLMEWVKTLRLPECPPAGLPQSLASPTYPVAFAYGLWLRLPSTAPVRAGVLCAAFAWAENMVQAAIKAIPLGQGAGQRVLAQVCLSIPQAVTEALQTHDAQRQAFSPMWAILSARHETQYSRLFRS
ncbi:urease accessory protein UreF [Serpentinimonas barnesii]|uniref:urease accessory protein UreF n=1 Tax=Serpentinimonas barnesii TaxID=1458427 RepID=UPI0005EFAB03|nr:urease accessory UreF family protein [Serpentinimonas barnesii]